MSKTFTRTFATSIVFGCCLAAPRVARAEVIGVLQLANGAATISTSGIQFNPAGVPLTGIFAGVDNTTAVLQDVNFTSTGLFMTFAALPGTSINLTGFSAGGFGSTSCFDPPAIAQGCSPPGSPVNFYNTPNGSVGVFSVEGTLTTAVGTTTVESIFTIQFVDQSYQEVLTTLLGGGSVGSSYSASFTSTSGAFSVGGAVSLSSTGLDFSGTSIVGSIGGGATRIVPLSSGSFLPLVGTLANQQNLLFASHPAGVPIDLDNFLTFQAAPNMTFDLTELQAGVFASTTCFDPPAWGQRCSFHPLPTILPYEFVNLPGGSVLSFGVDGLFEDFTGSVPSSAIYSLQFVGMSYQQVLATIFGGQSITGPFSATYASSSTSSVPEPASWLLLVAGAAVIRRRRRATGVREPRRGCRRA